ncbi:MAG: hypothetical protein V7K64_16640 [Nostoc sp.]|uniref:hypothetical protein n=1 Tax=Nostoc sp. TaxID=1180 RepID=UPI002FF9A151
MSTTGYAYALSFARHKQQAKLYNKNHEFVNENHEFVNENHDFVNENHEFVNENHDFVNENHEFVNENHDFGDDSLYILFTCVGVARTSTSSVTIVDIALAVI